MDHSQKIRGQIHNKEQIKKQDRLDYLEEGRKVREKIDNERQKLVDIQKAKIDELKTKMKTQHKVELSTQAITILDAFANGNSGCSFFIRCNLHVVLRVNARFPKA